MTKEARDRLTQQAHLLAETTRPLVIDADVHISDPETTPLADRRKMERSANYYHGRPLSAEQALAEMDVAGIDMALVWQNPAVTLYPGSAQDNYEALLAANRYVYESAVRFPERFIPAGWTDPKALGVDRAIQIVDVCAERFGFAIVKMNPAQNAFPIDSEPVRAVVDRIARHKMAAAFHFGADTPFTPTDGLAALAASYPDTTIIGVHMGGGGAGYLEAEETYHQARSAGLEHSNLYFALSAKRDTHMESDFITYLEAGTAAHNRLFCASDAPYGKQSWNFGGFRAMFSALQDPRHPDPRLKRNPGLCTAAAVQGFLGENVRALVLEIYRGLLSR